MVGGLTCRGGAIELTLDALIANTTDVHGATLHKEILVTADTILLGRGDIQREVLDADIVATLDGMFGLACHIQRAIALQLYLTLAVDTASVRAISTIGQGVLGVFLSTDLDALAIGDIQGSTTGIGHRETSQREGTFV